MNLKPFQVQWSNRISQKSPSVKRYVPALIIGIVLGIWAHSGLTDAPKEVHTVTQGPTVTVETTKEVVVPVMPIECQAAILIILKLESDLNTVTDAGGRQSDILKDAKVAILSSDAAGLNAVGVRQNKLSNGLTDARQNIAKAMTDLKPLMLNCSKKLQN